jgi:putative transposase
MTNHVHLILEPPDDTQVMGKLMRRLAGRQTRYVNRLEGRTGSLWDGRYKASPIQTERYLLACSRYVELNPVRARVVATPEDYPWSSYRYKLRATGFGWLDEDPCFRTLGKNHAERARCYRAYVRSVVSVEEERLIRQAVSRNQLTGDEPFIAEITERIGRRIELRGRGRPGGA